MREKLSILVVEPNESVRKFIALKAASVVQTVHEADCLASALELLGQGVDIVFTSVFLPDGPGEKVLSHAREQSPAAVVVAVTDEDDVSRAMDLVRQGAFMVLTKPVSRTQMKETLDRVLEQRRILEQNLAARRLEERYAADLESRVDEQTGFIRSLLDFSNRLNALNSMQEAMELVLETFKESMGCERISVLLKTPGTGEFAIVESLGLPCDIRRKTIDLADSPVVARVAGTGEAVYVPDVSYADESAGRGDSRSFVSVPMYISRSGKRDVFGVINLTDRRGGVPFTDEDVRLVQSITDIASVACSNLRNKEFLEKSYFDTVGALAMALEAKDPYTHGHSQRVTSMCMIVADVLGYSNDQMDQIMFAGMLHDVGKIGVPEGILLKKSRLNEEEFKTIREHPQVGERMVGHISFLKEAGSIIRQHHERWDGKGYPDGLRGEEVCLSARIMAVADSYDAMTTDRSYRRRLLRSQVRDELFRGRGSQFDPEILDIFIQHVAESRSIPDFAL